MGNILDFLLNYELLENKDKNITLVKVLNVINTNKKEAFVNIRKHKHKYKHKYK